MSDRRKVRPSRRQRARQARAQLVTSAGEIRVSILTGINNSDGDVDLRHEVRLVRSALLYADQVELLSPPAALLAGTAAATQRGPQFTAELFDGLDDAVLSHLLHGQDPREFRKKFAQIQRIKNLSRATLRQHFTPAQRSELRTFQDQLNGMMEQAAREIGASTYRMWERAGAPDLEAAMEQGILTVDGGPFLNFVSVDDAGAQFAELLARMMDDPEAHLMFDDQMGILTQSMLEESPELSHGFLRNSKRAHMGTGLISHLPAFPDASMETILQVRQDLAAPLRRYRQTVSTLSKKLAADPVDTIAVRSEIEELWRDEVQPSLSNLTDDLKSSQLGKSFLDEVLWDTKTWQGVTAAATGHFIQFGVSPWAEMIQPAAMMGGSTLLAAAARSALKESKEKHSAAKHHGLYYLVAINDRLA